MNTVSERPTDDIRRLVAVGVALGVVAAVVQALLHLTNATLLDHRVQLFELEEGGVVTWAATSATVAAATLALVIGFVDQAERLRGLVVAAILAFMSFDDAVILHERVAFRLTDALSVSASYAQVLWPTIYLPLLVVAAALLLRLAGRDVLAARLVAVGLLALASAIAIEVLGIVFERAGVDPEGWPRMTVIALEEGVEVVGWMLVATGLAVRLVAARSDGASQCAPAGCRSGRTGQP